MDEDFDRAQHRLRQELAARDTDQPSARWFGDTPPEQVDHDMMANYNRAVIAEAAHTTRPVDWFKVAAWSAVALITVAFWQGVRWVSR